MFLTRESQLLCLVPRAFMLNHSEPAHDIHRAALIYIQAIFFVVAGYQFQDPGEHWQVLHFLENCYEILSLDRQARVKFSLRIETMD